MPEAAKIVIIVNSRYKPCGTRNSNGYGAVGYTGDLIHDLTRIGLLSGVLYFTSTHGQKSSCREVPSTEILVQEIAVNFADDEATIRRVLTTCLRKFKSKVAASKLSIYHQSGALLPYTTCEFQHFVTHHGPFVADVERLYGADFTQAAFDRDADGLSRLRAIQDQGLAALSVLQHITSVEFSPVQVRLLRGLNLDDKRLIKLPPPRPRPTDDVAKSERDKVHTLLNSLTCRTLILTTCARLDSFKNIPMLIESFLSLSQKFDDVACLVLGDPPERTDRRRSLKNLIPDDSKTKLIVAPALPRSAMYSLFSELSSGQNEVRGIFCFPSKYETFGLTPLEAMTFGLTVIASNQVDRVGISNMLHQNCRFDPSVSGLTEVLDRLMVEFQYERYDGAMHRRTPAMNSTFFPDLIAVLASTQ